MCLEICVDSITSAVNAINGGANRLELCSSLSEGGLSPTPALLRVVKEKMGNLLSTDNVLVFCMIRPRGGPMTFSEEEKDVIIGDVKDLKSAGADGFVFGALLENGTIDEHLCKEVIKAADGFPCTFHRAFDLAVEPLIQLEVIIALGFKRILTSGCKSTALEGASLIKLLVEKSRDRIIIMAGAGVNADNCLSLIETTGVQEIHSSAKHKLTFPFRGKSEATMGTTDDFSIFVASAEKVRSMQAAIASRRSNSS